MSDSVLKLHRIKLVHKTPLTHVVFRVRYSLPPHALDRLCCSLCNPCCSPCTFTLLHDCLKHSRVPPANFESDVHRGPARLALFCRCDTRWTGMIRPIWSTHTHVMVERTQSVVGTGNRILFTRGTCFCHTGTRGHGWDELFCVTGQGQSGNLGEYNTCFLHAL